jgi:regulator of RNase E activity RraA
MLGFRVLEISRRVPTEWVEKFRTLPVANVSDVMFRMSAGGASLRPMHAAGQLAGPALTVKTRPGDNLMVHKALSMAKAGDVVVVDAGADVTTAIIGELMVATAQKRGLAGIVVNGAIRDLGAIGKGRFPVYAAGVTHRGPGEINVPISIGGMIINPGDLVIGDEDGLLGIPFDHVEAVYEAASSKHHIEEALLKDIKSDMLDVAWIDESLIRMKCEFSAETS